MMILLCSNVTVLRSIIIFCDICCFSPASLLLSSLEKGSCDDVQGDGGRLVVLVAVV